MRIRLRSVVGVIFLATIWLRSALPAAAAGPCHVALIMLDGFRRDYVAMYDMPVLHSLVENGVWVAEATDIFPANTTPNQAAFVTGDPPAVTGVPNNRYYDRASDKIISTVRDLKVPTIVQRAVSAGLVTVAVNHFFVLGQAGTNLGPNATATEAASAVVSQKPDLLVYYYPWTDSVGHEYGPYSPQMRAQVADADQALGTLVAAYQEAGMLQDTVFIVASDHSMSSNAAPAVPRGVTDALSAAGFKVFDGDSAGAVPPDATIVAIQIGSSFLYLRGAANNAAGYGRMLTALSTLPDTHVYDRGTLTALSCDPALLGDAVVSPDPGWLLLPSAGRGGIHGRPQESGILLVLSGGPVEKAKILQSASIVDIVPTALRLLGINPGTSPGAPCGKVIDGAIGHP